ncbi:MAG: DUF2283 domain-containing protein [Thermoplasmata archaeon]
MKYEYDQETDILLIKLSDEKPEFGDQSGPIITHYSKSGKPIEIEILDASETALSIIKPILAKKKKVSA